MGPKRKIEKVSLRATPDRNMDDVHTLSSEVQPLFLFKKWKVFYFLRWWIACYVLDTIKIRFVLNLSQIFLSKS